MSNDELVRRLAVEMVCGSRPSEHPSREPVTVLEINMAKMLEEFGHKLLAAVTRPEEVSREAIIEECAEICDAIRVERNAVADSDVALGALMCRDALRGPQHCDSKEKP